MELPEHKQYQKLYQQFVTEHSDDFSKMHWVEELEVVENALNYFKSATFPLVYPAKSYAVAIIYATLLEKEYGIGLRVSLDDPDLFLGQDDFFVPYGDNPVAYERILTRLQGIPNWINSGWAPKTVEYFRLECTEAGIQEVMERT